MTFRARRLAVVMFVSIGLCGCSAAAETGQTAEADGGVIELAVSELCAEAGESQCTEVGGDWVISPSTFERAAVDDAVVAGTAQPDAVDLTFSPDGASILNALTEEAAQSGADARLVFKVGDEVLAAVAVMEPLDGNQVTIVLSPGDDPQRIVDLIGST